MKRKRALELSVAQSKKQKVMKKQTASLGVTGKNTEEAVVILHTRGDAKINTALNRIGASVLRSATPEVTHLCIDEFKLTEEIMCGLAFCDHLVSNKWLERSVKQGNFNSNEAKFGVKADKTLKKVEKELGFKLSEVIARRERKKKKVFHGLKLYETKRNKWSLGNMFIAHGGKVGRKKNPNMIYVGLSKSDKEAFTGRNFRVHTPSWVYAAILRQKLPSAKEFRF